MIETIIGIIVIGAGILFEVVKFVLIVSLVVLVILHIHLAHRKLKR